MHLNGTGEGVGGHTVFVASGVDADTSYSATDYALWQALGDYGFGLGNRRCVITECSGRQGLSIEQVTPYSLRVAYFGAEAAEARWSVDLTHEDADGFGGYEVCDVTSSTGHSAEALDDELRKFHGLATENLASVLREQ